MSKKKKENKPVGWMDFVLWLEKIQSVHLMDYHAVEAAKSRFNLNN